MGAPPGSLFPHLPKALKGRRLGGGADPKGTKSTVGVVPHQACHHHGGACRRRTVGDPRAVWISLHSQAPE